MTLISGLGMLSSILTFAGSLAIAISIGPMGDGIAGADDENGNFRAVAMLKCPLKFKFGLFAISAGFGIDLFIKIKTFVP
ncbi:MAG: hypothetical protein J0L82_10220 [Deltaproteobacteria bacterium]|jgi:hypothetical protein|nr:hypothetical protein [Deltaproteobacteria bacterium]